MGRTLLQPGEARRHPRVEYQRRAWCEHHAFTLYLCIANLSHEGLFIQTSTPFARGERLRVALTDAAAGSSPPIEIEAEVRWSSTHGRATGIGCQIVLIAQGGERYAELVEQLAQLGR